MHWIDNPEQFTKHQNSADKKTREYAEKKLQKYDIVICGHTHKKMIEKWGSGLYINCGTCMHGKFEGALLDTDTDIIKLI